jgi:hypothetical protein
MADTSGQYRWLAIAALVTMIVALTALGIALATATAQTYADAVRAPSLEGMLWRALELLSILGAAGAVLAGYGIVLNMIARHDIEQASLDRLKRLESILSATHESARRLVDLSQMSDAAKSLLFRQREIEAMNELLHDELLRQEYDQASALVADIERRLGYAEQVKRLRAEIDSARESTAQQKVDAAVDRVRAHLDAHDWNGAVRVTQRLMKAMPDNPKIAALPHMIRDARAHHKSNLLAAYGEAVRTGDIDRPIELLRELDKYLTPQEAAALEESARGVFRAKLHNLGVQFSIRLTEEQWSEAVAIGVQIITEYPNSRMAQEVRLKMDTLKALAAQKFAAAQPPAPAPTTATAVPPPLPPP